jgi:polyhydroxyalkanoate synthesis regulator phasin
MGSASRSGGRIPEAVRRAVERTFQTTLGSTGLTRERTQEIVDEVVRRAEQSAARAGRYLRFATAEDMRGLRSEIERLTRRIDVLERKLRDREGTDRGGTGGAD